MQNNGNIQETLEQTKQARQAQEAQQVQEAKEITQPKNMSDLMKRLQDKTKHEQVMIEEITSESLKTLSDNISKSSKNAINITENAIDQEIENMQKNILSKFKLCSLVFGKQCMLLFLMGLALTAGITLGSWGLIAWHSSQVTSLKTEIIMLENSKKSLARAQQQELETLRNLQSETWNLILRVQDGEKFIILPTGVKMIDIHRTEDNRQGLKLGD